MRRQTRGIRGFSSRVGRSRPAALATAAAAWFGVASNAQLFRPPVVAIENARVVVGDGTVLERATIIIRGDRIETVGVDIPVPERAARIDAKGKTVTPGFIDVSGAIGNASASGGDASHLAADAFDRYDEESITAALANGVTTLYLPARGGSGITGVGTVVRLSANSGGTFGDVMIPEAAVCIDLGSGDGAIQRLQTVDGVRKRFRDARAYREARETYEGELAEYEKKIKERAEKAEKPAEATTGAGPKGGSPEPPNGGAGDRPGPGNGSGSGRGGGGGRGVEGDFSSETPPTVQDEPGRGPRPGGSPPGGAPAGPEGQGEPKPDEITKPQEPRRDAASEMLLKAIDRQLPVRIVAHRSADILNAIALANEFNLRLILEGATGADDVAEEIKSSKALVALDHAAGAGPTPDGSGRLFDRTASGLRRTGVDFVLGSGRDNGLAGRFLLLQAQSATESGADPIKLVTSSAAAFLGVSDRAGSLASGRDADLVIWSGDPLDPATRVESVYVKGGLAFSGAAGADGKAIEGDAR